MLNRRLSSTSCTNRQATGSLFSQVDLEMRVPARSLLRKIRQVIHQALASLDAKCDCRGQRRTMTAPVLLTDLDAWLCTKSTGTGAMPGVIGHAPVENGSAVTVQGDLTRADGRPNGARHDRPPLPGFDPVADLGAERGFVADLCKACITPQVAQRSPQTPQRRLRLGQNRRRYGRDGQQWPRKALFLRHPDHDRQHTHPYPATALCLTKAGGRVQSA